MPFYLSAAEQLYKLIKESSYTFTQSKQMQKNGTIQKILSDVQELAKNITSESIIILLSIYQ